MDAAKDPTPPPPPPTANSADGVQETVSGSYSNGKISDPVVGGGVEEDEDEGFLSGEEEFVAAPESPFAGSSELPPDDVVVDDDDGGKGSKDGVSEGGEAVVGGEKVEESTVSNGVSDDVEKGSKDGGKVVEGIANGVSEDGKSSQAVQPGDKVEVVPEPKESGVNVSGNGGETEGLAEKENSSVKDEMVDSAPEAAKTVEAGQELAIDADVNVTEPGADAVGATAADNEAGGVKLTSEGDSVIESINVDVSVADPGVAVVGKSAAEDEQTELPGEGNGTVPKSDDAKGETMEDDVKGETVEDGVKVENVEDGVKVETVEDVVKVETVEDDVKVETVDDDVKVDTVEDGAKVEAVKEDGVERTSEGDSVVETINVDVKVTEPGVVVVGEAATKDEQTEVVVDENPIIADPNAEIVGDETEKPGEEDGVKLTPEGDSIVETVDVDVNVVEPGVAVVGNREIEVPEAEDQSVMSTVSATSNGGNTVDSSGIANGPAKVDQKNIEGEPEAETEQSSTNGCQDGISVDEHAPVGTQYVQNADEVREGDEEGQIQVEEEVDRDMDGSVSDGENDEMIFGSSEAARQFIEELEQGSGVDSHNLSQRIDGQIVTDSEEEDGGSDEEGEGKELFDSAALAALLKAATGADSDGGGNITITSQDGSRLFSVERPAGLGSSLRALRPTPQPRRPNIFSSSMLSQGGDSDSNLTDEEKKKLEKLQAIRVKFLRLVHRLGVSPDESIAAQVIHRLSIVAGRQSGQIFNADSAKMMAMQLEAEKRESLEFSLNILVLGKCGVGKSATINSIFGEEKAQINAFQSGTNTVKEIIGVVDGVKIRVYDTPGLKSSAMDQSFNRSILSKVNKFTKKNPPDIILYVDRLDAQTRDLNDLPLLRTITTSMGASVWRNAVVTLTHASSAPPEGPSGNPLSYEVFVTQRSHVVQQSIGQAVGDLRMMTPSMMNPVSLAENHPLCRKNREGQKVLPNGQSWKPQLLLLCYSMKILSEASSLAKPQDPFDHRKLFGFRTRAPPLPYMLSSMLQSREHPKLPSDQGMDSFDSDIELDDLSDAENDEEDEYDQLPPFKPLRKTQIAKLSKDQKKAYFEEFDYRVKLLQKKQFKDELRRIRMMKNRGNGKDLGEVDYGMGEEDQDSGAAAPVAVPLPDMVLPPSFDSDNPGYRYRFLEPTSQFLARPVLDTHGWDHDCGYDGVNVEQNLALANRFPANVTVQVTKDKKDFSINVDSSISTKHGEKGSSMAGFDVLNMGKQLAYVVRGETKYKLMKRNKTTGGISVTFLGENVIPGLKVEDQITLGKQYVLVGSAGAVRAQTDTALGANFELQRRENDFPIGQVQSTFSLSLVRWRGDNALGFNGLTQINLGRNSKVAVRAGINNKMSGQISVRTSSSDQLSLALMAIVPTAISIYKKLVPGVNDQYMYGKMY